MKRTRTYPFGYELKNGAIVIHKREAAAVKRIYSDYEKGDSLQTIAEHMASACIPYSVENGGWDKHKVRRILINPCYAGDGDYPAILDGETCGRINALYAERTKAWQSPAANPEKYVWKRFICGECGERVTRIGGRGSKKAILVCTGCGMRTEYDTEALRQMLLERATEYIAAIAPSDPEPSTSLLRLNNEINRQLEKPSDPVIVRGLVLQAAAERYASLPKQPPKGMEMDWRRLKEMAEQIVICKDGGIQIKGVGA